ncbi:MAG: ABC transporter ATP-binding protein [Candidatus Heimdallarchaeaceae archaeon]
MTISQSPAWETNHVSLKIKEGEFVLILGPSGSGKTTLLSMIGCILTPTKGKLIVNGKDISNIQEKEKIKERRENIGFVFQSFNVLKDLTVRENVEVALNLKGIKGKKAKEEAISILNKVGLEDRIDFYRAKLSGGEKQRVSIARAIVKNPKIILADEPTGNLDSKTGRKIIELLKTVSKKEKATTIIVTHDDRIENIADRIFYLEDGKIIQEKSI